MYYGGGDPYHNAPGYARNDRREGFRRLGEMLSSPAHMNSPAAQLAMLDRISAPLLARTPTVGNQIAYRHDAGYQQQKGYHHNQYEPRADNDAEIQAITKQLEVQGRVLQEVLGQQNRRESNSTVKDLRKEVKRLRQELSEIKAQQHAYAGGGARGQDSSAQQMQQMLLHMILQTQQHNQAVQREHMQRVVEEELNDKVFEETLKRLIQQRQQQQQYQPSPLPQTPQK